MAILKRRIMVRSGGGYDTLHLETSADVVKLSDGRSVQTAIDILSTGSSGGIGSYLNSVSANLEKAYSASKTINLPQGTRIIIISQVTVNASQQLYGIPAPAMFACPLSGERSVYVRFTGTSSYQILNGLISIKLKPSSITAQLITSQCNSTSGGADTINSTYLHCDCYG